MMHMFKDKGSIGRLFLVLVLLINSTGFLFAAKPLQVLAPSTVSTIPFLELEQRFPDRYQVEFFTDHPQALARFLKGEVDLLATGFSVGYTRQLNAGGLVLLATPVWGVSSLMTKDPLSSFQELAGGTVYAPFEGSPIDIYLRKAIEMEGLSGKVQIEYAPFPQAAALLSQGKTEAAVLVEPIASRLEISGAAHRLETLHDGWARITGGERRSPQVSVFALQRRMNELGAPAANIAKELEGIVTELRENPSLYARRYSDRIGFPVPVLERAINNTLFDVPSRQVLEDLTASYAAIMELREPGAGFYLPR